MDAKLFGLWGAELGERKAQEASVSKTSRLANESRSCCPSAERISGLRKTNFEDEK